MSSTYNKILMNTVMPVADILMHTDIIYFYKKIIKMRQWSKEEYDNWQNIKLQMLLNHAYNNTVYYNNLFNKINIEPRDIKSRDDLKVIPVLTKNIIRDNFYDIIPKNINMIHYKKSSTGGSTGDPLVYYQDNKSWSFCNANNIINWERTGYQYGKKFIALGSTSLFVNKSSSLKHKIYYKLKNKIGLNGVNMSDEVCSDYVNLLQKEKINYIYGYASSIYLLAKYVLKKQEDVNIHACFTTSEVLKDSFRKTIKSAFDCNIVDCYGANDGGISAFARKKGFFEVGYNCIVRQEEAYDNGIGPALLTDLFNYAMPLINYKIGDVIQIEEKNNINYPYNGQIINKVMGRTSELLTLANGRTLTGPGFTVLFSAIPVEYYCIEKVDKNSLVCWIMKLPNFTESHEQIILETIQKQAGTGINIEIKETNQPFITKSGKRLYFI